ncbi:peptidase S8/S53 domain-containing protein [Trichoderma chlorosporum]
MSETGLLAGNFLPYSLQKFSPSESEDEDDLQSENVCQAVHIANDYSAMLRIRVHDESCRYYSDDVPLKYPEARSAVTCLLQLHDGPWLQKLWTSDNLLLLCENPKEGRKLRNVHSPFISSIISENPPCLPKPTHFDRYPLLLSFEKLPIAKTKTGEYSPYKTLKDNFVEMNTGSLSEDYKEAIEGCLKFQKFIKDEKGENEDIVQPLERNLRAFSKDIASNNIGIVKAGDQKDILLTTPQVLNPPPSRTTHDLDTKGVRDDRVSNLERDNYQLLILKPVNPHAEYIMTFPATETRAQLYQGPTTVTIQQSQPHYKQLSNPDKSSSSESESESEGAEGILFGTFDTRVSGVQEFASLQWGLTFKTLCQTYNERFQYTLSDESVKVAILDTGVDLKHLDFLQPRSKLRRSGKISSVKGEEAQIGRIKSCQNFCDDRSDMEDVTDIDGHGTHVAGIILQLAPTAELYIARMPRDRLKQLEGDKKVYPDRVERAIEWSIGHGVQLINMSFGYKHWDPKLDQALKKARDHGIVIFAAASNFGNHEQVAWPARDPDRAICIHSSTDFGTDSSEFTPKAHPDTTNFMVVGEGICSHWPESKGGGFRAMTGTSIATPVATAIAALLMAFTRQSVFDKEKRKEIEDDIGPVRLDDLSNMRALLKHICMETNGYHWIAPQLLWRNFMPVKSQNGPSAASKYAWEEIRKALRR